jgi:hypothetical protein
MRAWCAYKRQPPCHGRTAALSRGTVALEEMAKLVTDGSELCRRCRWGRQAREGLPRTCSMVLCALCAYSKIPLVEFGAEVR